MMKFFDPECRLILHWNKMILICSLIALCLDPLFLYIPTINGTQKCLDTDRKLAYAVCILRSVFDVLYALHIFIQFRTAVRSYNHVLRKTDFIDEPGYVAKHYLTSYFIIDLLAAFPLPQLGVLMIIPNSHAPATFSTENNFKFIICCQYVLRVIQAYFFYRKVTKTSGLLIEKAWAGATFNFYLYVLASHVVGALWYLFAIENEMRCWHNACQTHNCHSKYLYCGEDRVEDYGFLNTSCPLERNAIRGSTNFDSGIFLNALQNGVLETKDFRQKILYCSSWGFQSISSLGLGLKASTFYGEILFANFITAIGLVLFALLLGNMQSFSNRSLRTEVTKESKQEAKDPISHFSLPEELKQQVLRHKQYAWEITYGVDLASFVKDLPRDLRIGIKRHLCLPTLMRVPLFHEMNERLLDAMCDALKPVLFTKSSYIVREGDPAREMLFITNGKLLSETTCEGRVGFFSSATLKAGDFCGEEILTWALDPERSQQLPASTRTVKALKDVQAFAIVVDDLLFVVSQFRRLLITRDIRRTRDIQRTFRYYSQQWRTWAGCYILNALKRYQKRKLERQKEEEAFQKSLEEDDNDDNDDEEVTGNVYDKMFSSRFAHPRYNIKRRQRLYY